MGCRDTLKDFAIGCTGHFVIAIAAAILLLSGARFWGLSGRVLFVTVLVVIFLTSALIPWSRRKKE
jgi:antibiotic biosynthesis monooxygenase (ABM) superfamily enzyme